MRNEGEEERHPTSDLHYDHCVGPFTFVVESVTFLSTFPGSLLVGCGERGKEDCTRSSLRR